MSYSVLLLTTLTLSACVSSNLAAAADDDDDDGDGDGGGNSTSVVAGSSTWIPTSNEDAETPATDGGHSTNVSTSTASSSTPTIQQDDVQSLPTSSWADVAGDTCFRVISPVLILLTTVGNPLSIITLQNALFRKSSTSFILSALAVVDMGVVYTGLLRHWTDATFGVDFRLMSSAACKIHIYLTYLFRQVCHTRKLIIFKEFSLKKLIFLKRFFSSCHRCRI